MYVLGVESDVSNFEYRIFVVVFRRQPNSKNQSILHVQIYEVENLL